MSSAESKLSSHYAKRARTSAAEIDRILERLERHRCEGCRQVCLVPHILIPAERTGSRALCKPRVPLPVGFSLPAA